MGVDERHFTAVDISEKAHCVQVFSIHVADDIKKEKKKKKELHKALRCVVF